MLLFTPWIFFSLSLSLTFPFSSSYFPRSYSNKIKLFRCFHNIPHIQPSQHTLLPHLSVPQPCLRPTGKLIRCKFQSFIYYLSFHWYGFSFSCSIVSFFFFPFLDFVSGFFLLFGSALSFMVIIKDECTHFFFVGFFSFLQVY